MKLRLLSMTCLCLLLPSCTGPYYQTTASIITSLGQGAASVLAARYQGYQPSATGGYGGDSNYIGYDYGQQMPSRQSYAPGFGGNYAPPQSYGYGPSCQPMPCYYPAYQ